MSVKTAVEQMADAVGFDVGMSDNEVQAQLFNGFARAFKRSMPDDLDRDRQCCYIAEKLTPEAKTILGNLAEYVSEVQA